MSNLLEEEGEFALAARRSRELDIRVQSSAVGADDGNHLDATAGCDAAEHGAEQASSSYRHASQGAARLSVCCQLLAMSMAEICVSLKF